MKKFLFILLALNTAMSVYAQVNIQTGSAIYSMSMFDWQDHKSRLTSVVALNYSSGNGLRTNDVASNQGQGWSLVGGGMISRMQVGEPDDQKAYEGNGKDNDISRYPAGYWYSQNPAFNGCPASLTRYPIYKGRNQIYNMHNKTSVDKQLDYFVFQFNGKNGMFVLDTLNNGTGSLVGIPLDGSMMKITLQKDESMISQGIRTTITSFTIQDVDGLIYKFTRHGLTQVLHEDFCDPNVIAPQAQPTFKGDHVYYQAGFVNTQLVNTKVIGSWYLTEVDDPFTLRKITFNYIDRTLNNKAGADFNYNQNGNYSTVSFKTSITTTPELSSISYPDGHTVTFNYAATQRIDMAGEYALSTVDVTYQGRAVSEYQLNTTYFILNRYGTPTTPYQKSVARLCLRSVKKIGVDLKEDSPPTIFDYYLGSNTTDDFVPPPFFYAKDIWGYYNGDYSKDYNGNAVSLTLTTQKLTNTQIKGLCFMRSGSSNVTLNAKQGYAKNGLLKQVIYPTGGTLSYTYDQNFGNLNGSNTMVGGVHVTQTSSTDGGHSNPCSTPIVTNYNYTLTTGGASSLWGLEMPKNSITTSNHYASEQKKYHWTWSCAPFGCCYWNFAYPGIMSQLQAVDLSGMQKAMEALGPYMGVLSIITDIMDIATVAGGSTGFFAIAALVVDAISALLTLGLTCASGDNHKDTNYTLFYNSDLNGTSPLPMQFRRVEIVEGSGTMGKTVQEFTNSDDYALWVGIDGNPDFSSKQRFAPWAYGLPKLITLYDASGHMVKQTQNVYNFWNAGFILDYCFGKCVNRMANTENPSNLHTPLVSCKCQVKYSYSQRSADWTKPEVYDDPASYQVASTSDITVDYYPIYAGYTLLDSTYTRIYKTSDPLQYVQTTTAYTYDGGNNHEAKQIKTWQSDGAINTKFYTYSTDYPSTTNAALLALQQKNVVSSPITTATTMASSTTQGLMHEKVQEFTVLANGDVKPYRTLEQRFSKPSFPYQLYIPDNASNPTLYKTTETCTYDAAANLLTLTDEGGRSVTNIYDYDDKFIIGMVVNATGTTDVPAYTSFETSKLGGWTLTGTPNYAATAMTGARSLVLASRTLSAPLNTAKPYILSCWSTAAVTVTGGATLVKSAPTINGFTYYEYNIAQGTASVSVTGSGNIDELRLYPKTSRMRTTSYDVLLGKTAECDENNRINYLEYDNLGRLRFEKDENHYAVKMHEYNTISAAKQTGCPGSYSNQLLSETVTRTNCSAGYQGGDVTYTVPAGRYTSSISQQDADAQAEMDIMQNGPAYANANGACLLIYYNTARSETDSTESCDVGQKGGFVTYTVPANRYSSIISQADADQQAIDDIAANAIAYANNPPNAVCIVNTAADWVAVDGAAATCELTTTTPHVNTGGQLMLAIDQNPNSSTYNTTQYMRIGVNTASCPLTCNVTEATKWTFTTRSIVASGATVNFNIVAYNEGNFSFSSATRIGTYVGNTYGGTGCIPSTTKTTTVVESGRTWTVTVNNLGQIFLTLVSGTVPPTGPPSGSSDPANINLNFSISL